MLTLVMPLLTTIWNKIYGWVLLAGVIITSAWLLYVSGRRDARNENERDVLRQDLENRNEAENIRRTAIAEPDPVAELRKDWSRDGR